MTAVSVPSLAERRTSDRQAPATVAVVAAMSFVASVALASMIAEPLAGIAAQTGQGSAAAVLAFALVAPLCWCIFAAGVWAAMHGRASEAMVATTMRSVAAGIVPWIVLTLMGTFWSSGPQDAVFTIATLTIPLGAVASILVSAQAR